MGKQAENMSSYMKPYTDIQSIIRNSYNTSAAPGNVSNGAGYYAPSMSGSEMAMGSIGKILSIPGMGDAIGGLFGMSS
jgi:hypothetical protein